MNLLPVCVLYTQDDELVRRVGGYLYSVASVQHVSEPERLESTSRKLDPTLVFMDVRCTDSSDLISRMKFQMPESLVTVLAVPRSEPALEAESLGVYAVEDLKVNRLRLHGLVERAFSHLKLVRENRLLRQETIDTGDRGQPTAAARTPANEGSGLFQHQLMHRLFRHFDDVNAMLDNVVEVVQSFARVSRVGIFSRDFESGRYCLKAGIKCFEDSWNLIVSPEDPLVQWLQFNAHLVSRESLAHIRDGQERVVLDQSLDMLGAELIVPLLARDRLLGWLFIGHRLTGAPFEENHLEELMALAEHVSTSLENALLYSENAVQKTFAETVLQSIPVGIVSVDASGVIRWFNESAAKILEYTGDQLFGQHAAKLGSQLSDMLTGSIAGSSDHELKEWVDPFTKRSIAVSTERLMNGEDCLGAVAVIKDLTRERLLTEKQEQLERAVFWTELASAMSHEVRNPLVAVSTFAQLLPERYSDAEFRDQFSDLVEKEVARLNQMVDQIDSFANPPHVQQKPVNVEQVLKKASDLAVLRCPKTGLQIETTAEDGLEVIQGDEQALTECLTHLLVNALESLRNSNSPSVRVSASSMDKAQGGGVVINVRDNGSGISDEILEKIYSPFCTTKARGIGLGLPIARRTVTDHNGQIDVESSDHGTSVTMVLPRRRGETGIKDEAYTGS